MKTSDFSIASFNDLIFLDVENSIFCLDKPFLMELITPLLSSITIFLDLNPNDL